MKIPLVKLFKNYQLMKKIHLKQSKIPFLLQKNKKQHRIKNKKFNNHKTHPPKRKRKIKYY